MLDTGIREEVPEGLRDASCGKTFVLNGLIWRKKYLGEENPCRITFRSTSRLA